MHGKKRMLVICLGVFGLGSLGAAAADSLGWIVACRVLQGTGAAVFPLSFGIIRDEFPPERVGVAVGVVSLRVRRRRRDRAGRQRLHPRAPELAVAVPAGGGAGVGGVRADRGVGARSRRCGVAGGRTGWVR